MQDWLCLRIKAMRPLRNALPTSLKLNLWPPNAVYEDMYLGSNDEQGGLSIELSQGLCDVGAIDVGDEPHTGTTFRVGLQSLRDHQWTLLQSTFSQRNQIHTYVRPSRRKTAFY